MLKEDILRRKDVPFGHRGFDHFFVFCCFLRHGRAQGYQLLVIIRDQLRLFGSDDGNLAGLRLHLGFRFEQFNSQLFFLSL